MSNVTIKNIEDAVIAALAPIKANQTGGYVNTIESFGDKLEAALENPALLIAYLPAMLIVLNREDWRLDNPNAIYDRRLYFNLLVASGSLYSEADRRRGSAGTYQMMEDARKYLLAKRLSLAIAPLQLISVRAEFNGLLGGRFLSIYVLEFMTATDYTV